MSIRAITFDFWCTLFRDAHSEPRQQLRINAMTSATGCPVEAVDAALKVAWAEFDQSHKQRKITLCPADAVRITLRELGATLDEDQAHNMAVLFATAILDYSPTPIPGALEAVKAAAARGPVGLICDSGVSPGSSLRILMDRHGFTPYFTTLTFSDEMGVAKPQAPMFERTATALGVSTQEMLHIGDLEYSDIVGAKSVGASAALFTAVNDRYKANHSADYHFADWGEFLKWLPSLA
jgi:putative hydrolase of the HAD superfamily